MGYSEYTPGKGWSDDDDEGRGRKKNPDEKPAVPAGHGDKDTYLPDAGEINEPDLDESDIDEPTESDEPMDFPVPGIMPVTDTEKDRKRKEDEDYIIRRGIILQGIAEDEKNKKAQN